MGLGGKNRGRGMVARSSGENRELLLQDLDFRRMVTQAVAADSAIAAMTRAPGVARGMRGMTVMRDQVAGKASAESTHECQPNLEQQGLGTYTHLASIYLEHGRIAMGDGH